MSSVPNPVRRPRWPRECSASPIPWAPAPPPSDPAFVAITRAAGEVAVQVGRARGGLVVVSVIAAPAVARTVVADAAHRLAIAVARNAEVPRRSLFDLPLGDGPLWSIRD